MDYESNPSAGLCEDYTPMGIYICTACSMTVDVNIESERLPVCPCCEQPVTLANS